MADALMAGTASCRKTISCHTVQEPMAGDVRFFDAVKLYPESCGDAGHSSPRRRRGGPKAGGGAEGEILLSKKPEIFMLLGVD